MKNQLNRPAARAFLMASLTFLLTAAAPALGKNLAERLNLFIQLLDPLLIGAIGTFMSVIVFLDNFFRRSNPALSGVLGALNNLVGLIYLLVLAEMLTSISIPVTQIIYSSLTFVTINYQPVISLAVIAFAARMLRHSYQILFHEQLKETA